MLMAEPVVVIIFVLHLVLFFLEWIPTGSGMNSFFPTPLLSSLPFHNESSHLKMHSSWATDYGKEEYFHTSSCH